MACSLRSIEFFGKSLSFFRESLSFLEKALSFLEILEVLCTELLNIWVIAEKMHSVYVFAHIFVS